MQPAQPEIIYANKVEMKVSTLIDRLKSPRIIGTVLFFIVAYMLPIMFAKWFVSHDFKLQLPVRTIHPEEMWPIGDWIFSEYTLEGQIYTFVGFRMVYIISLKFSDTIITIADRVISDLKGDKTDAKLKKE